MWIVNFAVFLVLMVLLVAYLDKPTRFQRFIPKKVKLFFKKIEPYLLGNYERIYNVYSLTAFAFFSIILSFVGWGWGVASGLRQETVERTQWIMSFGFIVGILMIYVMLFFIKYFNIKVWQLSKTNKKLFRFVIKWHDVAPKILYAGMLFNIPFAFSIFFWTPQMFKAYLHQITTIYGICGFCWAFLMTMGVILTFKVPTIEIIREILSCLKSFEKGKKNGKAYRHMLSEAVDHFREIVNERLSSITDFDVNKHFEILSLAMVLGNEAEKRVAMTKIDNLISSLKNENIREFFEILSSLESSSELKELRKLRTSSKVTFLKKKKPKRTLSLVLRVISVISGILAIMRVTLPFIVQ